jgi:DNA polymerase-3 subunit alpha
MKPIVGCEFMFEDHKDKTRKDNGYQIVLWRRLKKNTIIWLKYLQ